MKKFNATAAKWNGETISDPEEIVFNRRYISQFVPRTGIVAINNATIYVIVQEERKEFETWLLGKDD